MSKRPKIGLQLEEGPPPITKELQEVEKVFGLTERDPLFHVFGPEATLPTKELVTYPEALMKLQAALQEFPGLHRSLHQSLLIHGATSSSLLAFTNYAGADKGRLIPTGQLLAKGKVPFAGTFDGISLKGEGPGGINNNHLSTVFVSEIKSAFIYAGIDVSEGKIVYLDLARKGWSPPIEGKVHEHPSSIFISSDEETYQQMEAMRRAQWDKLSKQEQELVSHPFAVVYGIRPAHAQSMQKVASSDVRLEITLRDGTLPGEIKVVYVPATKKKLVQELLSDSKEGDGDQPSIMVESIESLLP